MMESSAFRPILLTAFTICWWCLGTLALRSHAFDNVGEGDAGALCANGLEGLGVRCVPTRELRPVYAMTSL